MSEIREVRVSYSRTVNLGNYESERLEVGLESTVGDGEDAKAVTAGLVQEARMTASNWLAAFRQERVRGLGRHPAEDQP